MIEADVESLAEYLFEARAGHHPDSRPKWVEADPSEKANFYRDARAALEWFKAERA